MKVQGMRRRRAKHGAYAVTYTLVALLIVVALNYLADRYNKSYDSTDKRLHSLSDQSLKVLAGLEQDVKVSYFGYGPELEKARESLGRYTKASGRITVDYIDPLAKPGLARAKGVTTTDTTFVEVGEIQEKPNSVNESDITNAIIRLIKGGERTVCFVRGHGEADPESGEFDGFLGSKQEAERANFQTQTISLLDQPVISDDCTLLLLAGPKARYLDQEVKVLSEYVESGGRILFLIDQGESPELVELVSHWGVKVNTDVVLEPSTLLSTILGVGPYLVRVDDYEDHPIGAVMGRVVTLFPVCRTVERGEPPSDWTVDELFRTTSRSVAVENVRVEGNRLNWDPDEERDGPVSVAVVAKYEVPEQGAAAEGDKDNAEEQQVQAVEENLENEDVRNKRQGRIVVVGTSMFARNNFLGEGRNLDLFLNMLSWLSSDEDLISIRPRDPDRTPLSLTPGQLWTLGLTMVVGIPAVIIIAGIRVWWKRR